MALQMAPPVAAEVLGVSGWVQAHEAVLGVARERAGLESREGVCLLRARREDVHRHLGYGAFAEYTDRHLGYTHRTTEDKLRTAEALEHLPELARAQRDGRLNASAVRELARVVTAGTESAWIEAAMGLRVREVERLVAGRLPGDRPTDVPRPEVVKHVLRFEVSAETLAAFRDAMRCVAERTGQRLDDDAALLLIARDVSAPPAWLASEADTDGLDPRARAAGAARYQISIMECPRCKRGFMPAGADLLEIDPASLAAAHCDAQFVETIPDGADLRPSAPTGAGHVRSNPPPTVEATAATGSPHGRSDERAAETNATHMGDGASTTRTMSAPRSPRGRPDEHAAEANVTHVGDGASTTRTTQAIPRVVRRQVLARDHHTCRIPGCRNSRGVEVHHIVPRAEGGSNRSENLISICGIHHPAIHDGQLHVSGSADGLDVRHADGTPYGGAVSAPRSDVSEKVFRGLRWLGYKERDARAAIQAALREAGDASQELTHDDAGLLRRALVHLG